MAFYKTVHPDHYCEMEFREVVGDLFACPVTHSLAHCVSEDLKMGKGIAAIFKRQFGGIDTLSMQKASVGNVAILEHQGRYVYYLVTKKMFYHKPKYEQLKASLEAMKKHCLENNVTKLAMPRIGCGLDGLEWSEVSNVIKEVFGDTNVSITVYSLG